MKLSDSRAQRRRQGAFDRRDLLPLDSPRIPRELAIALAEEERRAIELFR